jgi:hypothetical protein
MQSDPNVTSSGLPEAAFALSLLGVEQVAATWSISAEAPDSATPLAPIYVRSGDRVSRLFFAANTSVAVKLELNAYAEPDDPHVVIVHSASRPKALQRSPQGAPGRTGEPTARHVDMVDILADSPSYSEARRRFREEITV